MPHVIARCVERVLRLFFPPSGRRRAVPGRPSRALRVVCSPGSLRPEFVLRGEDCALVRPYLTAHERHLEEERLRRSRRRELWFAVHGVDAGTRIIHGMEVA